MRKAFLLIALVVISLVSNAQLSFAPRIGVGLTSSAFSGAEGNGSLVIPSNSAINFNIGAEARYRLTDILSIHSGLFYDYIQAKNSITVSEPGDTVSETLNNKLNYISLPIQLVYGKEGVGFYGGAGIDFALGISGKAMASVYQTGAGEQTTNTSVTFDGDKDATDNNEHLRALNIGIALKAGYCFSNNIFIGVDAIFGLSNLYPDTDNGSYKLSTYGIHVGYVISSSTTKK